MPGHYGKKMMGAVKGASKKDYAKAEAKESKKEKMMELGIIMSVPAKGKKPTPPKKVAKKK